MTDEENDTSDIAPLGADFFARAALQMPQAPRTATVTLVVDADVLAWFQAQGESQNRMNAALRLYAAAHQEKVRPN